MSYRLFQEEMAEVYKEINSKPENKHLNSKDEGNGLLNHAEELTRDKWIEKGRYKELVSYFISNYEAGGGDSFVLPLSDKLLQEKEIRLFKKLWKQTLKTRIEYCQYDRPSIFWAFNQFTAGLEQLGDSEEIGKINQLRAKVENYKQVKAKPTTDKRKIDERLFWELIHDAKQDSIFCVEVVEKLAQSLESCSLTAIKSFHRILHQKMNELNSWDLWALAFIARDGCGDDEFDYFRAWILAQGKKIFES